MGSLKKICFFSPSFYYTLQSDMVGGAEIQQELIARHLLGKYSVSFIVAGKNQSQEIGGIEIINVERTFNLLKRFVKIWNALSQADADIYYSAGMNRYLFLAALFCKLKKRKLVFAFINDPSTDSRLLQKFYAQSFFGRMAKFLQWHFSRIFIKRADAVLVQNLFQKKNVEKNFGKSSLLVPNAIEIGGFNESKKSFVLWVGHISAVKQPELAAELASKLPGINFVVIGNKVETEKGLFGKMSKKFSEIENVKFIEKVPFPEIGKFFESAIALISTSSSEGFPNVFLQAWEKGIPVVSLNADPDEIICRNNLGFHSGNLEKMASQIKLLSEDIELNRSIGKNCREYCRKNHDAEKIIALYEKVFG